MFKGNFTLPGDFEGVRELEKGVQCLRKGDTHVLPVEKTGLYSESEGTQGKVSVPQLGENFGPS